MLPVVQAEPWDLSDQTANCIAYGDMIQAISNLFRGHAYSRPKHDAPHITCGCGFYGYSEFEAAQKEYAERINLAAHQRTGDALCLGVALFWGPTIIGDLKDNLPGVRFRSRHARALAFLENPLDERVQKFAKNNGLPVASDPKYLKAIAKEHSATAL